MSLDAADAILGAIGLTRVTRWSFVLPINLPSANAHVINGKQAASAAIYRAQRDKWAWWTEVGAREQGIPLFFVLFRAPGVAPCRRRVTITRLLGARQRDYDDDNLVAACKGLRDAMQRPRMSRRRHIPGAAIVVDDSAKWSEWRYAQERAADGKPAVRVEIEDITEPAVASAEGK